MPYQFHYAVPRGLLGPWGIELWVGEGVEFPPGTILFYIPLPAMLRIRLCISLTKGWWKLKKTFHLNIGVGSVPAHQVGALNFTKVDGAMGDVYTNA